MRVKSRYLSNIRCSLSMVVVLFLLIGCASRPPAKPTEVSSELTPQERAIHNISISEDEAEALVTIHANQPLIYTAVKHQFPLSVVLYFRDTALKGIQETFTPDSALIKTIEASELKRKRPSCRIEIRLNRDITYEVTRAQNELLVHFRKAVEELEEVPEEATKVEPREKGIEALEKAKPEIKKAEIQIEKPEIEIEKTESEIEKTESEIEKKEAPEPPVEAPVTTGEVKTPAVVNRIDFETLEGGKSRVVVEATGEIRCETEKSSEKRLLIKISDARIPEFQKRPLITTRFKSAVDRILPIQSPKMGNTAVIAIELREPIPYRVEQKDNACVVEFEASMIPPRPAAETKRPEWLEAMRAAEVAVAGEEEQPPQEPVITEAGKRYTGERISLNFQNADIHNIFRILHEVSGKNFVIGDDVKGRVTLKLENVPWDQVLELMLKMNKLGTAVEGNVIRIVKLSTLKEEQKALQDALRAEQEAKDQQPLMTDYIPINYSDASKIKSHLEEIKSNRGRVTYDERTNTIIMKDIEPVLEHAKELAKRLDLVTPQVIIEAKIVEASTDFSREFGIQWGGQYGIQEGDERYGVGPQRAYDTLGGTYGFEGGIGADNWIVNLPAAETTSAIGFNFARLNGLTPLTLKANLQAMESGGKGKIISSPRILTMDNKTAYIEQGVDIPYQVLEEGSYSLKWAKAVLKLTVTPHITMDRRVSMEILAQKDSPDRSIIVQGAPAIDKKEAATELLVNDGDTIVIGGIITRTESLAKAVVPGLSKLPVLGWLFKTNSKKNDERELLIFVTSTIVDLEQPAHAKDIMVSRLP